LRMMGLLVKDSVFVNIDYEGKFLKEFEMKVCLIHDQILMAVFGGTSDIRVIDIVRMRSYLRKLKLEAGIIAYWKNDEVKILGVGQHR